MYHTKEKNDTRKANIMLIDDDFSTNYYHQIILKEAHIAKDLTICKSADNALEKLKSLSIAPDIIFLDINMPKKDGWDFLKEYRQLDDRKKAKMLVMLSSTELPHGIKEEKKQNIDLVDAFNLKPLMVKEVSSLINQLY
jgi:CheY-like chemotaxis protein